MKITTLRNLGLVLGLILALVTFVGPAAASDPVHWSYEGAEGPEHWGELSPDFALCTTGQEQTPIDIPAAAPVNPAGIEFNYQPTALNIFNNGHTVQVNYDPGSSIEVDGKTYELKQFHFHTPSEHTVAGQPSEMELHLVHQAADGQLAVVGVMLTQGSENANYAPVFDNLPAQPGDPTPVSGVSLNASDLLPAEQTYYRYNGSLTTPPCSEGVQWLLMNTPVELAEAQITAFQQIIHDNVRPIQPFNARSFLETSAMTSEMASDTTSDAAPQATTPEALPTTGGVHFPVEGVVFGLGFVTTLVGLAMLRHQKI